MISTYVLRPRTLESEKAEIMSRPCRKTSVVLYDFTPVLVGMFFFFFGGGCDGMVCQDLFDIFFDFCGCWVVARCLKHAKIKIYEHR